MTMLFTTFTVNQKPLHKWCEYITPGEMASVFCSNINYSFPQIRIIIDV